MKRFNNWLRQRGMNFGTRLSNWGSALFNLAYEGSEQERGDVKDGIYDDLDPDMLSVSTRALLEQDQTIEGCSVTFAARGAMFGIVIRADSAGRATTTLISRQTVSELRVAADLFLAGEEGTKS